MTSQSWTDIMDRAGQALWEVVRRNPEINYIRAEVALGSDRPVAVLDADPARGVVWVDEDGHNDRQVVRPDGELARDAEWLAQKRREENELG